MDNSEETDSTNPFTVTDNEVFDRFMLWLQKASSKKATDYKKRPLEQRPSIMAEAVVWEHLTRTFECEVEIGDDKGGADFLCKKGDYQFLVEVKHLENSALSERTGLPDHHETAAYTFSLDNYKGRGLIQDHHHQLQNDGLPVVLALCSSHAKGRSLFSELGTRSMMFGNLGFTMSLGGSGRVIDTAAFEKSLWLKQELDGTVSAWGDYPSAVLLFTVEKWASTITGLLHPAPKVPLDYRVFPKVPFRRFSEWPPRRALELEWVVEGPSVLYQNYHRIDFGD